ncbi:hypothetical protein ACF0H5_018859 [Mactra antiquata]
MTSNVLSAPVYMFYRLKVSKMDTENSTLSQDTVNTVTDEKPTLEASTSNDYQDKPPSYEATVTHRHTVDTVAEHVLSEAEEEKILNLLRDVVRKCTLANPLKRPTAREVLKMIEEGAPRGVLTETYDDSDSDDDED